MSIRIFCKQIFTSYHTVKLGRFGRPFFRMAIRREIEILQKMASANANADRIETEISIAQARIESIKAGLIGLAAVGLTAGFTTAMSGSLPLPLNAPDTLLSWFVNLAVAMSSGFFFGVTYRYIVRQDDNLHLSSGAVGAFGMVRSLSIIEAIWNDSFAPILWLLIAGESFLWFAIARYTLDFAIRKNWIQPLD